MLPKINAPYDDSTALFSAYEKVLTLEQNPDRKEAIKWIYDEAKADHEKAQKGGS